MSTSLRPCVLAAALVLSAPAAIRAQEFKISGLVQVWATQMLDSNLRLNPAPPFKGGKGYYDLRSEFKENGFSIRRAQLKVAGRILDSVGYELMADPSIQTSASNPSILQDAVVFFRPMPGLEFRLGQFKTQQTYEGLMPTAEMPFVNGSQLGRLFGDKRDRGITASYASNFHGGWEVKATLGVFNGMTDATAGKGNDTNAQKDLVVRLEAARGPHRLGVYALRGATDVSDRKGTAIVPADIPAGWPGREAILDHRDRTSNLGAFYVYKARGWMLMAEGLTGLLGRRAPTLAASDPALRREHLEQTLASLNLAASRTWGRHTLAARYDWMDFNHGRRWYTAHDPYREMPGGGSTGRDFTPRYTEATLGYTFAWVAGKSTTAHLKLDGIFRSRNILAPDPARGQTAAQGGDSLVASFLVAF